MAPTRVVEDDVRRAATATLFDLTGQLAIVTGAGRGIGRAAAEALGRAGADILLVDVSADDLEHTRRAFVWGSTSSVLVADVREASDIALIVSSAQELGGADVLVNSAGIMRRADAVTATLDDLDEMWAVNFRGMFAVTQALLPQLIHRHGRIIQVGSLGSVLGLRGRAGYAATKGAVRQYTQSLAVDLGSFGVRVNAIAPGYIETDMNRTFLSDPDRRTSMLERIPLGRLGSPADLDGTFVYLASRASDYLTGQTVVVDGGWSIW